MAWMEVASLIKVCLKWVSLRPGGRKPQAAQTFQMASFRTMLDHFGPKVGQMLQMVSFGIIFDHFGPWPPSRM